ncbi:MAG: hypothetical protein M1829_003334 [Trizodia sp. TS-e1964]|nr:MAG: hypothetical protein M1829_003334 [Trizodia sp. TS-e1964]
MSPYYQTESGEEWEVIMPRNTAAENISRFLASENGKHRRDLIWKLGWSPLAGSRYSLLYQVTRHLRKADLLRLCLVDRAVSLPCALEQLWTAIKIPLDSVWTSVEKRKNEEKFRRFENFVKKLDTGCMHPLVENTEFSKFITKIEFVDKRELVDEEGAYVLQTRLQSLMKRLLQGLLIRCPNIQLFCWNSHVPFSSSLFTVLGQLKKLNTSQFLLSGMTMDHHGLLGPSKGLSDFAALSNSDEFAICLRPETEMERIENLEPAKSKIQATTAIILQHADEESIIRLVGIIADHFTKVDALRINGILQGLPEANSGKSFVVPNRTLSIKSLHLVYLGSESQYIARALNPAHLRDLNIEACFGIQNIVDPLLYRAKQLAGLRAILPSFEEQSQSEYTRDLGILLQFVRSKTFRLKQLSIHGIFGDALKDQLFAAFQCHLPHLEQITIADEARELEFKHLLEIASCAPNLLDLRIRAFGGGLLDLLPTLLPKFQTLRALAIIRPDKVDPVDRRLAIAIAMKAGEKIPLQLFAYHELTEGGDDHWYYMINSPDKKWTGGYPENVMLQHKSQLGRAINYHQFHDVFSGWASAMGIRQREHIYMVKIKGVRPRELPQNPKPAAKVEWRVVDRATNRGRKRKREEETDEELATVPNFRDMYLGLPKSDIAMHKRLRTH